MSGQQAQAQQTLEAAQAMTGEVQRELVVASGELGLAHGALERHLPDEARHDDVAWAIEQSAALERKVQQAADDLEEVQELLERAKAEVAGTAP